MKIVFLDRATISPHTTLRTPGFPHELRIYENEFHPLGGVPIAH